VAGIFQLTMLLAELSFDISQDNLLRVMQLVLV